MSKEDQSNNITLRFLEAIDAQADACQRARSERLGVALGLTNFDGRHGVRNRLVKLCEARTERCFHDLISRRFAEKKPFNFHYFNAFSDVDRQARVARFQHLDLCLAKDGRSV